MQKHEGVQYKRQTKRDTRLTIKRSVNQPTGSSVVLAWISERHLCGNLKLTFFAIFSLESRRAQASISFDCETRLTSCVILAELIFAAGVLNQKRKIFKSKQELTREKGKERNKEKKESLFVKEPSANPVTPWTTSVKKWSYILPMNLAILVSHSVGFSLLKLSRNWI